MEAYAAYSLNESVRMKSSSGGVFSLLAESVILHDGVVYGVAMTEDCYSAEYIAVIDEAGLSKLRGSKYLHAKVGDAFKKVKADLQAGRVVLFTGTGCAINGLRKFLGGDYENLYCVDVICHGVPSPALWKRYVEDKEKVNGGKIKYVNFRCKDDSWESFGIKEAIDIGSVKMEYSSKDKDPYMQMFLRNYCLRPSCYSCVAKREKMSDITIADFWGIENVAPEMNDSKGVSFVLVRTEQGRHLFSEISGNMKLKAVTYEESVKYNLSEYRSVEKPPQREIFFPDMRNMEFKELARKYADPVQMSLKGKLKCKVKNVVKQMLNLRGGVLTP